MKDKPRITRRGFIGKATKISLAAAGLRIPFTAMEGQTSTSVDNLNIIGPKDGYTPHVGSLLSMMNWMRETILYSVEGMNTAELDYLHDGESNSIGAMLWHLASTERFYQLNTFDDKRWGSWSKKEDEKWETAMNLGAKGRKTIKGYSLDFYRSKLDSVRAHTKSEFAKRDDDWLFYVDEKWGWGPTNNYCKWFHVCEHESNHNGQIKYIKSRVTS